MAQKEAVLFAQLSVALAASVGTLMLYTSKLEPSLRAALAPALGAEGARWVVLAAGVALAVTVYTAVTRVFSGRTRDDGPRAG